MKKGDAVEVTGGTHKGRKGAIEHLRAATETATVRFDDNTADTVPLTQLKAAKAGK